MSADFEEAWGFLDVSPETITKNVDFLSLHERQKRQLSILKKRMIAVHDLVSKYREKNILLRHAEKRLSTLKVEFKNANVECQEACKKYKDVQEKCEALEQEISQLQGKCTKLESEWQRNESMEAATQSYTNQLQQLVKERDSMIDALKLENNVVKDSTVGLKRKITKLGQIITALTRNLASVADVVFTKRILNRREKMALCKYMRMNKVLKEKKNRKRICELMEEAHNSDNELIVSDDMVSETEETVEEDNDLVNSAENDETDKGHESDNAISEDTGRGSSLACSDKSFLSPAYSIESPLSVETGKSKNKDVDSLAHTSPIQSPRYVKETREIATSPIMFNSTSQKISKSPEKAISKILFDQATSPLKYDSPSRTDIPDIVVTIEDAVNEIEPLPMFDENDNLEGIEPLSPVREQQDLDKYDHLSDENSNDGEIELILENMRVARDLITPIPVTPARSISRVTAMSKVNKESQHENAKMRDDIAEIKNTMNSFVPLLQLLQNIIMNETFKPLLQKSTEKNLGKVLKETITNVEKAGVPKNNQRISEKDVQIQEKEDGIELDDCASLDGDPIIITVSAEKEHENENSVVIKNSMLSQKQLFKENHSQNQVTIEMDTTAEEDPIINLNSKLQQQRIQDLSQNEETIEMGVMDTIVDEDPIIIDYSAELEREIEKVVTLPKLKSPRKVLFKSKLSQNEETIEVDAVDTKKTTEQSPNKQGKTRNKKLTKLEKLKKNLLPKSKIQMPDLPLRKLSSRFIVPITNQKNKSSEVSLKNKEAFEKAVKILAEEKLKQGDTAMKKNNLNCSLYGNGISSRNSNITTSSNNSTTVQTKTKKNDNSSNYNGNGESCLPVSGDFDKKSKRTLLPLKKVEVTKRKSGKTVQSQTEGVETRRRRSIRLSTELNDSVPLAELVSLKKDEMPNRKKCGKLVQSQTEGVETRRRRSSRLSTELIDSIPLAELVSLKGDEMPNRKKSSELLQSQAEGVETRRLRSNRLSAELNDSVPLAELVSLKRDEMPNRKKSGELVQSQTEGVETRRRRSSRLSTELNDSIPLAELKSLRDVMPENNRMKSLEISPRKYEMRSQKMSQGNDKPCKFSPNKKRSDDNNRESRNSTEILELITNEARRKSLTPEFDSVKVFNRSKYPSFSLDKDVVVVLEHSDLNENLKEQENNCTDKHEPATRAIRKRQPEEKTESPLQRILRSSVRSNLEDKGSANINKKRQNHVDSAMLPRPEDPNNLPSIVSYTDLDLFSDEPAPKKQRLDNKPHETSDTTDTLKPHESVLCKVIEKYGINGLKRYPPKIPEAVVNSVYEKIDKGISRINEIPPNNNKQEMDKFVEDLKKIKHNYFLAGLIKYLADPQRKLELFNITTAPPTPPMTKSEQVLLYLIIKLKEAWPNADLINQVLKHIEYNLFKLNAAPEFDVIGSMAHFYAVLCRYIDSKSRVKLFMFAAMYAYNFKAMTVIKQCLEVWMHTLPLAHMGIAKSPLVTIVVYLLHYYKPQVDTYNVVQDIRKILSHKYFYKMFDMNEQKILDMCKSSIVDLKECPVEKKMLRLALILLAKRQGPRWCQTKLITNILQPMIYRDGVSETAKAFCVSILGALVKPYPVSMKVHAEIILNQLLDILLTTNPSPIMQEALFTSLISLYRHNQNSVIKAMLQWYPDSVSQGLEKMLKEFVREKTISTWKRLLRQIYLDGLD